MKLKGLLGLAIKEVRELKEETKKRRREVPDSAYMSSYCLMPLHGANAIREFIAKVLDVKEDTIYKIAENKCFET